MMSIKFLLPLAFLLFHFTSYAMNTFRCSKVNNHRNRVANLESVAPSCNSKVTWSYEKMSRDEVNRLAFRNAFIYSNMGGAIFNFKRGKKKVYRSAFLGGKLACIDRLVKKEGVNSIINLYAGSFSTAKILERTERELFKSAGGKNYIQISNYDYHISPRNSKEAIYNKLVDIIEKIARSPRNVLIHCYGGMHRTGIVYGVLQKCINKLPIDKVIQEYRCHTAYENKTRKGGAHKDNIEVLKSFPCQLLSRF